MLSQIEIVEGHAPSSYFWFKPVHVNISYKIVMDDDIDELQEEFSIEEGYVDCFLKYFFYKYFDPDWECNKNRFEYGIGYIREFEWYLTHNFYTYETIEKMCEEMLIKAELLECDFDNPDLTKLKENFSVYYICENRDTDYIVGDNSPNAMKRHIRVVVHFYRHFVKRLTQMMENNPETNIISIMGP